MPGILSLKTWLRALTVRILPGTSTASRTRSRSLLLHNDGHHPVFATCSAAGESDGSQHTGGPAPWATLWRLSPNGATHLEDCKTTPGNTKGTVSTIWKDKCANTGLKKCSALFLQILETVKNNHWRLYWIDLYSVPDQPSCGGYAGLLAAATHSLTDQRHSSAAWPQTELWGSRRDSKITVRYT